MKTRLALLTQWYDPEPALKGMLFAQQLSSRGYKVKVITGFPNYPGGKIYDGYKIKLFARESNGPIEIIRLPLYPSHSNSKLGRIANYISFMLSTSIYCVIFLRRIDVLYAYHPPLTTGITAALFRVFRRKPVVYDIQDLWPDTLSATGMINNGRILKIVGIVAKLIYQTADHITVLSPGFKQAIVNRGIDKNKITVIPNWCDEGALQQKAENHVPYRHDPRFKLVFAGNMGKAQALEHVLDAAKTLQDLNSNILFVFIGPGVEVESLKEKNNCLALKNTLFLDPVPGNVIGNYLKSADALLAHLKKDDLFKINIPSKIQSYMEIGKPLLVGIEGDAADIVSVSGAGIAFEPENQKSLTDAILKLISMSDSERKMMGDSGRNYYLNNMSLSAGVAQFDRCFQNLLNHRSPPKPD